MSNTLLFIIGTIVFFLTTYGVVMAGGLLLMRQQLTEDHLGEPVDATGPEPT